VGWENPGCGNTDTLAPCGRGTRASVICCSW